MTEHPHLSLALELELGTDPMRGRLLADDGTVLPFRGWLEMAEVIGAAFRDAQPPTHEEPHQ